jgi:hypothetical protein
MKTPPKQTQETRKTQKENEKEKIEAGASCKTATKELVKTSAGL